MIVPSADGKAIPDPSQNNSFEDQLHDSFQFTGEYTTNIAKYYTNASAYENMEFSESDSDVINVKITISRNIVSVSLFFTKNDTSTVRNILNDGICFTGEILSLNGNGYYDDRLILGSFMPENGNSIALYKIIYEETDPVLTLLVENLKTGQLTEYSFSISYDQFTQLMRIAKDTTTAHEGILDTNDDYSPEVLVAQEVVALMQPSRNYLSPENASSMRAQSNCSFQSTSTYTATAATDTELKTFCYNVNNSTSSGITPSTTMQTVLSQTGWKMYKTSTYFYVMHGVANTSTEQLVGITAASVSNNTPTSGATNASYTIIGSCTLSYNKTTKIAKLLQYDTGIRLENATIAVELVGGTTNFFEATKTWNLVNNNSGVKNILVAISAKLGIASAIWDALFTQTDSSATVDFGTDSNQTNVYGGLVRATGNQTNTNKYLWGYGNSLGINTKYYVTSVKTYSSHRIAYAFTAYSLL